MHVGCCWPLVEVTWTPYNSLLVAGTFDAEPLLSFTLRFLMPDQAVKVLKEQICI